MTSILYKNMIYLYLFMLIFPLGCKKDMQSRDVDVVRDQDSSQFRIVGYLYSNDNWLLEMEQVQLSEITHLHLAFINPDANGEFHNVSFLTDAAKMAHQADVKIFASIGGGGAPAYLHDLLKSDKRDKLIEDLVNLAVQNDLDGIDVDLEGSLVDQYYEDFVINLAEALHKEGKKVSAAVATWYADRLSDKALAQYDFINIMSYDKTGPWDPAHPGPHSPYSMAVSDLNFWKTNRSIPKEKLNLGVPFYGRGFGLGAPSSLPFKEIVAQYPDSINLGQIHFPEGGVLYFNGIPMMKEKTKLAQEQVGGIMIWQLANDAKGKHSLLKAINEVINLSEE